MACCLILTLLKDKNVIYFYVGMDDTALVHVANSLDQVLCPDAEFLLLDRFVFCEHSAA